tara:strand:- start:2742 stop:3131 length:390 start_codon:yes stop_codon:yes gene_type:complete
MSNNKTYTPEQLQDFCEQESVLDTYLGMELLELSPDAHSLMRQGMNLIQARLRELDVSPFDTEVVEGVQHTSLTRVVLDKTYGWENLPDSERDVSELANVMDGSDLRIVCNDDGEFEGNVRIIAVYNFG